MDKNLNSFKKKFNARWLKRAGAVVCLMLMLTGCGASGSSGVAANTTSGLSESGLYNSYSVDTTEDSDYNSDEETTEANSDSDAEDSDPYQRADVKLIRTASLDLETLDFNAAVDELDALVDRLGGYTESSNLYQGSYGSACRSVYYTIRIPAKKYDEFLDQMNDSTTCRMVSKNENTEDVGQEYFDTETHLKTLRTKLERLESLLEKADKMEDIISLENAISDTEYQISSYTTTLNRYDSLIGYATFNITIEEVSVISDSETIGFGSRLANAFVGGWQDFISGTEILLLGIIGSCPALILLAALIAVLVCLIRRRKKKKIPKSREADESDAEEC